MEKLRGHGLRDDAIGMMQVGETITEILINGWWIISVEDCMTNNYGHGYYLELSANHQKRSLIETGFLTIDGAMDGLFVASWHDAMRFVGWNIDWFKDRTPDEPEKCGWCGATTYPHICDGTLTEQINRLDKIVKVTTANASEPKPSEVAQEDQDKIDMSEAFCQCSCVISVADWEMHPNRCEVRLEGERIQRRKDRVARYFRRKRA